ncbi:UDP-N-acetylmuramate dehydrogenase [Enterobacteriaceae endosymbiont of Neohaemonia nigricornis]|uniref:UDP-N-acetylmuramate dehydrogenase n=1 Tax=Enterobacteriaceae endosymbiont of Neohaemonia nigricornis TaxID=2675792 RepID=UPI001449269E|nr:UDP-N-acetylmuramate dehydrogenase [Enterobacteriaceae endosymbiont of Neohaemonia nigricornis]QJC30220.1 UDP-N-acetylmuramate dehydrogenase [Enterobacteriaceae endosymbiont of Neohaemonia nigricornis]
MLSLKKFHTFHTKVYAYNIIKVYSIKQLCDIWKLYYQKLIPCLILGNGSNVLFTTNFQGIVLINRIKGITIKSDNFYWYLHVAAGENWHNLVQYTIENNMYGLENLALIPGCIGAAPIQNIGAYGVSLENFCIYVDIINLYNKKKSRLNKYACKFSYRSSIFKHIKYHNHAVIALGLALPKKWYPNLNYKDLKYLDYNITAPKVFKYICNIRKKKIPNHKLLGNAGSFFKNPLLSNKIGMNIIKKFSNIPYILENNQIKISAGWLIEKCKSNNLTYHGATIYSKQSLIIINKYNASGQDIIKLATKIYYLVGQKFNIWLEPEVRIINSYGEILPYHIFKKH